VISRLKFALKTKKMKSSSGEFIKNCCS